MYAPKGIEQCYGMYSHGRNYSLYAYVPARQVYDLTVMNLVITLVMYILVLTFVQGFRWNSAKDFFMQQENSEQEYKKSLEQKTPHSSLPFSVKPRPISPSGSSCLICLTTSERP